LPFTVNLTGVPEGNQSITIYAQAISEFEVERKEVQRPVSPSGFLVGKYLNIYSNYYLTEGSSTINFEVNTATPTHNWLNDSSSHNMLPYVVAGALGIIGVVVVGILYFSKRGSTLDAKTESQKQRITA